MSGDEAGDRAANRERVALRVGLAAADVARHGAGLVLADVGVGERRRRTVRGRERERHIERGRVEYLPAAEMCRRKLGLVLAVVLRALPLTVGVVHDE